MARTYRRGVNPSVFACSLTEYCIGPINDIQGLDCTYMSEPDMRHAVPGMLLRKRSAYVSVYQGHGSGGGGHQEHSAGASNPVQKLNINNEIDAT